MKFNKKIKHFTIDKNRDKFYVDVEFYQMNLIRAVEEARKRDPELFVDGDDNLPSWTKTSKNPLKAKGFLTTTFEAVFEGKNNLDELNADYQFDEISDFKVEMIFFSGSTTKKNLSNIVKILDQTLPNTIVLQINGDTMTNATAEKKVKETIEKAKKNNMNVLLASAGMAQRSFSIGDISAVYLAYDEGSADATTQKVSRALTPKNKKQVGRIVSLSFDPNRDDKFDDLIMESAKNLAESKDININEATKKVLKTISLKMCTEDGASIIDKDDYLEQLISNDRLDRVIGRVADLTKLSKEQIREIASGKVDYHSLSKKEKTERGKTTKPTEKTEKQTKKDVDEERKMILEARKVITTISENIDIILTQGGSSIDEAFEIIDRMNDSEKEAIHNLFDIDYESLKNIVNNVMNKNLLELKFSKE